MAFPIAPDPRRAESDGDFYVADPFGLRKAITPVYVRDLNDGTFRGCGTSFYINPFGRQLSAMHVITDFFNAHAISVRPGMTITHMAIPNELIGILHDPGLVYGTAPAGDALYVTDFILFPVDQTKHALAITFSSDRLRFVEPQLDLASWNIGGLSDRTSVYLPIRVGSASSLEVGDRVLALGFPTNISWRRPHAQIPTFHEEMRGSVGHVIQLHTEHDPERKIWPRIVVDVRWAPGMSGGPVFNEDGIVVGIVSRGSNVDDASNAWSSALWLEALPYRADIFGYVDRETPGNVYGWAVCNQTSAIETFPTKARAEEFVQTTCADLDVRWVSVSHHSQFRSPARELSPEVHGLLRKNLGWLLKD